MLKVKDLKTSFIYGMGKGILYYAFGALLTWLLSIRFPYHYSPAILVYILFLLGGLIWAFRCFVLLMARYGSKAHLGILIIHIIAILLIVIGIYIENKSVDEIKYKATNQEYINTDNNTTFFYIKHNNFSRQLVQMNPQNQVNHKLTLNLRELFDIELIAEELSIILTK